jgi:hypothetical protein
MIAEQVCYDFVRRGQQRIVSGDKVKPALKIELADEFVGTACKRCTEIEHAGWPAPVNMFRRVFEQPFAQFGLVSGAEEYRCNLMVQAIKQR